MGTTSIVGKRETVERIIDFLRRGHRVSDACEKAGIGYGTFSRWRREEGWIKERVKEEIEADDDAKVIDVEDALYKKAMGGNVLACIFYLKNRSPERWQDLSKIQDGKDKASWRVMFKDVQKIEITNGRVKEITDGKERAGADTGGLTGGVAAEPAEVLQVDVAGSEVLAEATGDSPICSKQP